mmetsp:Transcript_18751/g.52193  ORF Transcript_18751/g.52193 Transcript_18751/m.52193 type:complete len:203 (-) Transcript_18751:1210-1818(-)
MSVAWSLHCSDDPGEQVCETKDVGLQEDCAAEVLLGLLQPVVRPVDKAKVVPARGAARAMLETRDQEVAGDDEVARGAALPVEGTAPDLRVRVPGVDGDGRLEGHERLVCLPLCLLQQPLHVVALRLVGKQGQGPVHAVLGVLGLLQRQEHMHPLLPHARLLLLKNLSHHRVHTLDMRGSSLNVCHELLQRLQRLVWLICSK